jgi:hypothetical protein
MWLQPLQMEAPEGLGGGGLPDFFNPPDPLAEMHGVWVDPSTLVVFYKTVTGNSFSDPEGTPTVVRISSQRFAVNGGTLVAVGEPVTLHEKVMPTDGNYSPGLQPGCTFSGLEVAADGRILLKFDDPILIT